MSGNRGSGDCEVQIDKKWQKRFFVVKDGNLYFYKEEKEYKKGKSPSSMDQIPSISSVSDISIDSHHYCFQYQSSGVTKFIRSEVQGSMLQLRSLLTGVPLQSQHEHQHQHHQQQQQHQELPIAIRVSLAGAKLLKKDSGLTAKSDPFFKLCKKTGQKTEIIYRSEIVSQNLSPQWNNFVLNFTAIGGAHVLVWIEVYDFDPDGETEFMGKTNEFEARYLAESAKVFNLLEKSKNAGTISVVKSEKINDHQLSIPKAYSFTVSMKGLPRMDGPTGRCDPFFEIIKMKGDKKDNQNFNERIYISEVITKSLNPTYNSFIIDYRDIVPADDILVTVYDRDDNGTRELIGQFTTSFAEFHFPNYTYPIIGKTSLKKNNGLFIVTASSPAAPLDNKYQVPNYWQLQLSGKHLPMEGVKKKPDPFFVINSSWGPIFRSNI